MLNLVHFFWIEETARRCPRHQQQITQGASVCGDDLVAFWPEQAVDQYHKLLDLTGAKRSTGKHFVSKIGRGVFTEEAFETSTVAY